ncbi:MAG: tetratricopeptide repeat protein [Actinobacteria bacterium]|nr:MAG: tetratricopeptide repeat protein [Actinomycetota bacterium]
MARWPEGLPGCPGILTNRLLAGSYYQLGNLAYLRGDYDTAESRYHQSLEINKRLGNQAGMATNFDALAILQFQREEHSEAIAYEVRSLAIHLRIGSPQASAISGASCSCVQDSEATSS